MAVFRGFREPMKKLLALVLVMSGLTLVGLFTYGQYLAYQARKNPTPLLVLEDTKFISDNPTAGFVADDGLNSPKPDHLSPAHVYYVSQSRGQANNGSEADPWRDLQTALCRLEPGDQLMVLDGIFRAVQIDERCMAGELMRPIEVYFSTQSQIVDSTEALISIAQPHWKIYGAQLTLGGDQTGVLIAPNTHSVHIESAKINGGQRSGIEIGHNAHDISIKRSHIHHIGHLSGTSLGHAIVLAPGVHAVRVTESKLHHLGGEMIAVIPPSTVPSLAFLPEASYELDAITAKPSEEDAWWDQTDNLPNS